MDYKSILVNGEVTITFFTETILDINKPHTENTERIIEKFEEWVEEEYGTTIPGSERNVKVDQIR